MSKFLNGRAWAFHRKRAVPSIIVVIVLVMVSAASVIVASEDISPERGDEGLGGAAARLRIVDVTCEPSEAVVDQEVTWAVAVEILSESQSGKGLLFTWDWDDGSCTVYHLKSVHNDEFAADVQAHSWAEPGLYNVEVSVWDCFDPEQNKFHNVSAMVPFIVTEEATARYVDYYWYDMFNHPIGQWYDYRASVCNDEFRLTDEYPYLYLKQASPPGNTWIYTFMRLDIDARNLTEVNMNENPEFLPFFGDSRGGTAEIDWYLNYITYEEGEAKLPPVALSYFDGWFVSLNGTVTLDEQAAKAVLGVTSAEFEGFNDWWADNQGMVNGLWQEWMIDEAGPGRLDIYWMYEYPLTFVLFEIDAEKVGDEIVLTFDTVSWGLEALMTRWLHEAFIPTEWYMEDMSLQATIRPEKSTLDVNAAVAYSAFAYESVLDGTPCWAWEAMMQDYVLSYAKDGTSLFDYYWNWSADDLYRYYNVAPGSAWHDNMMPYDRTPGAWNLSQGETLTFEWPDGPQMFFVHDPGYTGETLVGDTRQLYSDMSVAYAEPMPSDTDHVSIDEAARQISFVGPFDMWTWSKEQTAHEWLADEWDRMNLLPHGIPFIEFSAAAQEAIPEMVITGLEDGPYNMGEQITFTVTIQDALSFEPIEDYEGTITFMSDDPTADLPDDYTFVPGDLGSRDFTVTFNTVDPETHDATWYLTVTDVSNSMISATVSSIHVVESPVIDHFSVEFAGEVYSEEAADATVTAYNQWDEVFTDYEGTADFESNDTGAVIVPEQLDFTGLDGVGSVSVTFSSHGDQYLNVSDSVVTEATGSALVTVNPVAVIDHFELSGVNDPAQSNIAETMRVTAIDQYDRDFDRYEGTVVFDANRTGEVTLPAPTDFTLGETYIDVSITFTAAGMFMVWANESGNDDITGSLEVWVCSGVLELDHFNVFGITNMWENNYSDITVMAIDDFGGTYEAYEGTITFSTNAPSGATLPLDYTFVPADNGVHTFPLAVSFDEPGTYYVSVEDTFDDTKNGNTEGFEIIDLYTDSMEIACDEDTVVQDELFSAVVTVYHQFAEVFVEYDGTVTFDTSDTSGLAVLPSDYVFFAGDAGKHTFDGLSLNELGAQTVTVEDTVDASLADMLHITVTGMDLSEITWMVYDMFGEPPGPWWDTRLGTMWDTERLLTSDSGSVTYMSNSEGPIDPNGFSDKGIIYAPYRWNVEGIYLPNADVHNPVFMPVLGTGTVAGAEVTLEVYCQYAYQALWDDYVIPIWSSNPNWDPGFDPYLPYGYDDGYVTMALTNVTMNREAAEEWLGMGQSETPADWWAANRDTYRSNWQAWMNWQGNDIYDIWCGYEWFHDDILTLMDLEEDGDDIVLKIFHTSWGYEALLTRWLLASELSMHQPYMEDITMVVDYRDDDCDFHLDAVAQWSLHCVKQNLTTPSDNVPCAWAWEPIGLDYIPSVFIHPSDYDPYVGLTYQSWNCGDPSYSEEVPYEVTPWAFSLPSYGKLVVELPQGSDVTGYYGEVVPSDAMALLWYGDSSAYDAIRYTGEMDLGYCMLGDAVWDYDEISKVLTVNGPYDFENPRDGDLLYHGAPWIEFNVAPLSPEGVGQEDVGTEELPMVSDVASAIASACGEQRSLATPLCAAMLTIAALVGYTGRRRELQ